MPAGYIVPFSMRMSWTAFSSSEATIAYATPPMANASIPVAPLRAQNPPCPSLATPAADRVPSSLTRISWTARSFGPAAVTIAYVMPPSSNVATPRASSSASKSVGLSLLESVAESAAARMGCIVVSITMAFDPPSEPVEFGSGSVLSAGVVPSAALTMLPPLRDRADALV